MLMTFPLAKKKVQFYYKIKALYIQMSTQTLIFTTLLILLNHAHPIQKHHLTTHTSLTNAPITLQKLLQKSNLTALLIQMQYFSKTSTAEEQKAGISALLFNQSIISTNFIRKLSTVFSFSPRIRFISYLPAVNATLVSDPNDKLCKEQVQSILKLLSPCNHHHPFSLISSQHIFQENVRLEIKWTRQSQIITLDLWFYSQPLFQNHQSPCGSIVNSQVLPDQAGNDLSYSVNAINKWYQPKKRLSAILKIQDCLQNKTALLMVKIPFGCTLQQIKISNNYSQHEILTEPHTSITTILITLTLALQTSADICLLIDFQAHLPQLQCLERVGGGGQQMMVNWMYLNSKVEMSEWLGGWGFEGHQVSIRYLEPDFSIPFHTITFTVGIIGYLYINLWRITKSESQ